MFALEHMESSTNIKICNQDLVVIQLLHKEPSKNNKTFESCLKVTSRRTYVVVNSKIEVICGFRASMWSW